MQAIIIARVSTEEQKEAGLSLPAQIARLEKYCQNKSFAVMRICSFDESAYKEQRNEFDAIIDFILEQKEKIVVCCDKVDRLSRNTFDKRIATLYERAVTDQIELHFVSDGQILTSKISATEKFQFSISLGLAKYYSDAISDNVKRALEQKWRKGEWCSRAPLGYKNITLAPKKKIIEIDPATTPFIIKAFEMYATGTYSFQTVAQALNKLEFRSVNGNPVQANRIEEILKNHFYYGVMQVKGEFYRHKYPPLISQWLFERVQDVMHGRYKAPVQYAGKEILFRGLISCHRCGCTVSGDIKKQKYIYYSCGNSKGICSKTWIREEKITGRLFEYFDKVHLADDRIEDIIDYLKQTYAHEQEILRLSQQKLRKELDQIQARLSKLIDMHLDGAVDSETYHAKLQEYKQRQREITTEMQVYVDVDEECLITAKTVFDLAKRAREIFESSKMQEKQQFLKFFFSNLKQDGQNLLVELQEPFSTLAKINDQPEWRHLIDAFRKREVVFGFTLTHIRTVLSSCGIELTLDKNVHLFP